MNHHTHDRSLRYALICSRPTFDHEAIHRADVQAARGRRHRHRTRTWARTLPVAGPTAARRTGGRGR